MMSIGDRTYRKATGSRLDGSTGVYEGQIADREPNFTGDFGKLMEPTGPLQATWRARQRRHPR